MPASSQETVLEPTISALPIHIRRFQPGDEASFLRLNEAWIVKYFVLEAKDREVLGDPVKYIMNPGGEIIFATIGEEIVGCCALVPAAPGEYEVAKMAVTEGLPRPRNRQKDSRSRDRRGEADRRLAVVSRDQQQAAKRHSSYTSRWVFDIFRPSG